MTKTIYVRVQPNKQGVTSFFRCGMLFILSWRTLHDVDAATAKRLEAEQMLEVTETRPPELDEAAPAGDSAAGNVETLAGESNAPASAPTSTEKLAVMLAAVSAGLSAAEVEAASGAGQTITGTVSDSSAAADTATATAEPTAPVASDANKPADPAAVIEAVKAAIAQLDPANTDLYTAAGKPKTDALAALTGWPVTAAERDAALGE